MAVEQVHQAVVVFGNEERDADRVVGAFEPPAHLEAIRERLEAARELGEIEVEPGQIPLHAHEEEPALGVLMLVGVEDVRLVPVEELADCGNDPLAVRAGDEQHGGVLQGGLSAGIERGQFFILSAGRTEFASGKSFPLCLTGRAEEVIHVVYTFTLSTRNAVPPRVPTFWE